jgi:hypothetical protein
MPVSRRDFLSWAVAGGLSLAADPWLHAADLVSSSSKSGGIDRQALVGRHHPVVRQVDPFSVLSVGNGRFAFNSDVTGLQTFLGPYDKEFPLCTVSHWGWHTTPPPAGLDVHDFRYTEYDTYGREVGYATDAAGQQTLFNWLRENPHRLHLGRIGFELKKSDGSLAQASDISNIRQELNLWSGVLVSQFELEGKPARVTTACHPTDDALAATIESPLLASGQMTVLVAFPYGSPKMDMADWNAPDRHQTVWIHGDHRADFQRTLNATQYQVSLAWTQGKLAQRAKHEFILSAAGGGPLEFVCRFSPQASSQALPSAAATRQASLEHRANFWTHGGCVDLSASTDARTAELERRIVLSLYNTALHDAGSLPSQETGLLYNSWYGKFHLEMHWWHSAHFAAWNRFELLNNSLGFYPRIIGVGLATAKRQGYLGCRWPKMVGPEGRDSPSPIAPLLIWQQPHQFYYAELAYRQQPTRQTLEQWRTIVFDTAEFLASFAVLDPKSGRYMLGPPMKTVSENTPTRTTKNPTFELAYWRFGLRIAQQWRQRLGMAPHPKWADVLERLCPLPVQDGLYLMQEGMTDTYTHWNWEHPALLGAYGMQPGDGVDPQIMRRTVRRVMQVWQWDRAWGWDFPMAAMAAARCGEPELAIEALMIKSPKNRYLPNGHVYQRPNLTAYLPANGGLLSAIAMMSAGWTGGPAHHAPGFPRDGKWSVKWEDLRTWI